MRNLNKEVKQDHYTHSDIHRPELLIMEEKGSMRTVKANNELRISLDSRNHVVEEDTETECDIKKHDFQRDGTDENVGLYSQGPHRPTSRYNDDVESVHYNVDSVASHDDSTQDIYHDDVGDNSKLTDVGFDVKHNYVGAGARNCDVGDDVKFADVDADAKQNDVGANVNHSHIETNPSHEDGAPVDRGWAWMICLCCFMLFFIYGAFEQVIAVLLLDILEEFDTSISTVTVVLSLSSLCYCVSTQISANVLVLRFSARSVETCAALINVGATMLMAGLINVYVLFIAVLLKASSRGVTLISTLTLVGFYFRRRRALAVAVGLLGGSISVMVTAPLIRYLREEYGLRGCFLLFAGIELHAVIATLLLRPLSSYEKKSFNKKTEPRQENKQQLTTTLNSSVKYTPCQMGDNGNNKIKLQCENSLKHGAKDVFTDGEEHFERTRSNLLAAVTDSLEMQEYSTKDQSNFESTVALFLKEQLTQKLPTCASRVENSFNSDKEEGVTFNKIKSKNGNLIVASAASCSRTAESLSLNTEEQENQSVEAVSSLKNSSVTDIAKGDSAENFEGCSPAVEFSVGRTVDGRSDWNFVTSSMMASVLEDTSSPVVNLIESLPILHSSIQEISISQINRNIDDADQNAVPLFTNEPDSLVFTLQSSSDIRNVTSSLSDSRLETVTGQNSPSDQGKNTSSTENIGRDQNCDVINNTKTFLNDTLREDSHGENKGFKGQMDTDAEDKHKTSKDMHGIGSEEEKLLQAVPEEDTDLTSGINKLTSWDITYPFEHSKALLGTNNERKHGHLFPELAGSETPVQWGSVATSLMGSALNIAPNLALNTNPASSESKNNVRFRLCSWVKYIVDFSVLKNCLCLMVVLAYATASTGSFTAIYLPSYAVKIEVPKQNAALLLTVAGALDMFGLLFFGFIVDLKIIRPNKIIAVACLCLGVANIMSRFYLGFHELIFFSVLIGLFAACCQNLSTALIVDVVGIDFLAKLLALSSLGSSLAKIVQHPIQGALIEYTGNFLATFTYVGVSYILTAILLLSEPWIRRLQVARENKKMQS